MTKKKAVRKAGNQVEIYGLCDPIDGKVRYVGKAVNSGKRFKSHLREMRRDTPLYRWIAVLRSKKLSPVLAILATCGTSEWQSKEIDLISEYRKTGNLLNVADGGNAPFCSIETRAKNGRSNSVKRADTDSKKKIWWLKCSIGQALKQGYVREDTKVKLRHLAHKRPDLFGAWANI